MSSLTDAEILLSRLLTATTSVLSKSELSEIKAFVDVGEYGLALETVVDIFSEEKRAAPSEVVVLIEQAAKSMGIDPTSLLERLPKKT